MELRGEHLGVLFRQVPFCRGSAGGLGQPYVRNLHVTASSSATHRFQGVQGLHRLLFADGSGQEMDCRPVVAPPFHFAEHRRQQPPQK